MAPAAPGAGRGQGSVQNVQHGPNALGRPTQPSSTQQVVGAATVPGTQQPNHYTSFYSQLANTVMNVVLIGIGLVLAGIYGKIAEKQGNENLKATLWRDCIDLPDTIGTTETCKKLLATGFDSLSKRSIQIQEHGVPSRLSLFWEELSALAEIDVLPSLLWISALWLDVFGRITVDTISLEVFFALHTRFDAIFITAVDTNQRAQGRISLWISKVWHPWMDLFSFVIGHMFGYLISEWRGTTWPRRSLWVFVTQALHFDIAVYLMAMMLPGKSLQKPSPDHTSGLLGLRRVGFIAMLAWATSLSWIYYYLFYFISPNDVSRWQNAGWGGALWTLFSVTITPVGITLPMVKTHPLGVKYLILDHMAFIFSLLKWIPYLGAMICDYAEKV